jgi:hypothetical protein
MGSRPGTRLSYQQRRQRYQDKDIEDAQMNNLNTARASNIKHNSPEVKDVCYFAERVRTMLEVKKKHLRAAMWKSINLPNIDMVMVRIQALEWVQAKIQDLILDNVTTDYPFYDNDDND